MQTVYEQVGAELKTERIERERNHLADKRAALQNNPFDPRTEVSADARKICSTIWTVFVIIPVCIGVLYSLVSIASH